MQILWQRGLRKNQKFNFFDYQGKMNYKQVAIVLTKEPITKQDLCVNCATCFLKAVDISQKRFPAFYKYWLNKSQYMKVVLKCTDEDRFDKLKELTRKKEAPAYFEGRVIVIGPAPSIYIDQYTKDLKLL